VIEALVELGLVFGASKTVTTSVLDTFDGELHRSGLRLEFIESDSRELVLSGDGVVPAHLAVDAVPLVPDDLPPGPFRSRLNAHTGIRALMPQIRERAERRVGTWRDASGKVVVVVELHQGARVVGHPDIDATTTLEVHEVAGYARPTRRVCETLQRVGATEAGADRLTRSAHEAGVDLAGYTATATVPLDADMAAVDGFRAVLGNLATVIDANWQGAIDQTDTVFLHQLRIALRRTRTILKVAGPVLPTAILEPAREQFAWLASATGTPRDLDVYLLEWDHYTGPLGADIASSLAPVRDALERDCAAAHRRLEATLRSERATNWMREWRTWLDEPLRDDVLPRRAEKPLASIVARRIGRAHDRLVDKGRAIDAGSPAEQVHDLRKDTKRLRYLLDCFGSLLPDKPRKRFVKRLKELQENLGEFQDAEVHIDLLAHIAASADAATAGPDTIAAGEALTERLAQQRRSARAEFAQRFADFDSPATRRALDALLDGLRT